MEEIIVPIFVCVVLPVAIVWIVFAARRHRDSKRTEVLLKAIEMAPGDAEKIAEALSVKKKTAREILNARLLRGCIFSPVALAILIVYCKLNIDGFDDAYYMLIAGSLCLAIGIGYLIVYFLTRKGADADDKIRE